MSGISKIAASFAFLLLTPQSSIDVIQFAFSSTCDSFTDLSIPYIILGILLCSAVCVLDTPSGGTTIPSCDELSCPTFNISFVVIYHPVFAHPPPASDFKVLAILFEYILLASPL